MSKKTAQTIFLSLLGLIAAVVIVDRYFLLVYWSGHREVQVQFDSELQELDPVILNYDNQHFSHIENLVRLHAYGPPEELNAFSSPFLPERIDGKAILKSRGGGRHSAFLIDEEGWLTGFAARIATQDGQLYLAWTEAIETDTGLVATFTLEKAQRIHQSSE